MLLAACDDRYLSEAEFLIKSCARHEPGQRFYLYLVSTNPELESAIQTWHPNIIINRVAWPYEVEPRPGLMNCLRSIALQKALEAYQEPTLYLDSDILLRGKLAALFETLDTCDLMVKFRPELKHLGVAGTFYASIFNSGVIAIRPSPSGKRFVQEYNSILNEFISSGKPIVVYREEHRINVYADQELLYVAYSRLQDQLQFKPLPDEFNDAKFDPSSIIWHGKGTARKSPRYVREKLRYRNRILMYPYSLFLGVWILSRSVKRKLGRIRRSL